MSKIKRGHFCWCCQRILANERFSGGGHARHLCKACSRLGPGELAARQAPRDIDRIVGPWGTVRRRDVPRLEPYARHEDERVRRAAAELLAMYEHEQAAREAERRAIDEDALFWHEREFRKVQESATSRDNDGDSDLDIPF